MRTKTFLVGILLPFFALAAGATAAPISMAQLSDSFAVDDSFAGTGFSLRSDTTFHPVALEPGVDDRAFEQPAGASLSYLGTSMDAQYGRLLHIGLDVDPSSNLPSDIWIRAADLEAGNLIADPSASGLSEMKAMTYCYKFVKQYLLATHEVPVFLPGGSAYMAASILPHYGFHRSGRNQYNAVNGDVCVYSGGNGNNGHIEVKRNGDWWYGYGFIPHPISLTNHHLLGCFDK